MDAVKAQFYKKVKNERLERLASLRGYFPLDVVEKEEKRLHDELEALDLITAADIVRLIAESDNVSYILEMIKEFNMLEHNTIEVFDFIVEEEDLFIKDEIKEYDDYDFEVIQLAIEIIKKYKTGRCF